MAPDNFLKEIIGEIIEIFPRTAKHMEISLEANPDSLGNVHRLNHLTEIGFNRVTLGVQTTNEQTLRYLGRRGSLAKVEKALTHLHQSSFKNYGIDLIYGVPGQKYREIQQDIDLALSYGVKHVSAYGLTVEENTPLNRQILNRHKQRLSERRYITHMKQISRSLTKRGFQRYEISNYALPGYQSLHNMIYWTHRPYLGLGPASHSFLANSRICDPRDLKRYMQSSPEQLEKIDAADHFSELMIGASRILGKQGLARFRKNLSLADYGVFLDRLSLAEKSKYLKCRQAQFQLNENSALFSDSLLMLLAG